MAIEKMKHLQLAAMEADRPALLSGLQHLGCVEVSEQTGNALDWAEFAHISSTDLDKIKADADLVSNALTVLDTCAPVKTPLFRTFEPVQERELFDDGALYRALKTASQIRASMALLTGVTAKIARLQASLASLQPWLPAELPLECTGTEKTIIRFGTLPAAVSMADVTAALDAGEALAELFEVSADREVHYVILMMHRASADETLAALKPFGFSNVVFKDMDGTAREQSARLSDEISRQNAALESEKQRLAAMGSERAALQRASDRLTQDLAREAARQKLLVTDSVFFLTGWVLADRVPALEKLLEGYDCALELRDPEPEEIPDVPVSLKNNRFTRPLNMVTEMYSLPAYDGIDPNPLLLPCFSICFGIMYADFGYGLILLLLGILGNMKIKRQGTMKHMCGLLVICGITTAVFGFLFGSFFGDSLDYRLFGWLRGAFDSIPFFGIKDPLSEPLWFMVAALVVGFLHLVTGQCVHIYMECRDGHPLEGILDVVPWWLTFAGIAVLALGHGFWLLIAGVLSLICTQGRKKPTLIGKIFGGISSLYDITNWLSDILSYTRLMALLLAGGVIANVFNMLGNMTGNIIFILIIFIVGHIFNMAINIIGTFVHAARLQYLEFFGKFYKDGGKPFHPFAYNTKYTEIIKEEN